MIYFVFKYLAFFYCFLTMAKKTKSPISNCSHELISASISNFFFQRMQSFEFPIQQKKNFEKILKTAPVRHLFVNGLKKAQICLTIAKKTGYLFKFDSRAYLCINIQIFFQRMQSFKFPIQQKKNFEKILKTAPASRLFVNGLTKAQICLTMTKKTGYPSKLDSRAYLCINF